MSITYSMMRSTAGLQVCLDAGTNPAERWQALHTLGPALIPFFGGRVLA